jgi:hypothetical protein
VPALPGSLTAVSKASRPLTRNVIVPPRVQPGIESGPTTLRVKPEKLPVRRTDDTPHRVAPTYASMRVPPRSWRPSGLKTEPPNSARGGTDALGLALAKDPWTRTLR